jgi:hypothetical protein
VVFYPAALLGLLLGQSSVLMGALFAAAAMTLERRPILAGACLGLLVCKPQLILLVPLALVAGRRWRAALSAAASAAGLGLASLAVFGPGVFTAWLRLAPLDLAVLDDPDLWPKMIGLYPALRLLGAGAAVAAAAQSVLACGCAVVVWRVWRRRPAPAALAVLAVCDLLATPYAFAYDLTGLIAPLAWLAGCRAGAGLAPLDDFAAGFPQRGGDSPPAPAWLRWAEASGPAGEALVAGAAYGLAFLAPPVAAVTRIPVAPAVLGGLLILLLRRSRRRQGRDGQDRAAPCISPGAPVSPGLWTLRGPFFGFGLPAPGRSRGRASSRPGAQGMNPSPPHPKPS